MRRSDPTSCRTRSTSAPKMSKTLATSLMNEIFVARKAFDAYLMVSADAAEGFGSGEDVEVGELLAERLDAFPVTGAVFRARDRARVGLDEAGYQGQPEFDAGHLGDVVEVEAQAFVADALDDLGEEAEQALIPHALVIEGG